MKLQSVQFKDAQEFPWGTTATYVQKADDKTTLSANEGWVFVRREHEGKMREFCIPVVNCRHAVPMPEKK